MQVIYVRPGYEVDLDSLVKDAIRLNSSVNVCWADHDFASGVLKLLVPYLYLFFAGYMLGVVRESWGYYTM